MPMPSTASYDVAIFSSSWTSWMEKENQFYHIVWDNKVWPKKLLAPCGQNKSFHQISLWLTSMWNDAKLLYYIVLRRKNDFSCEFNKKKNWFQRVYLVWNLHMEIIFVLLILDTFLEPLASKNNSTHIRDGYLYRFISAIVRWQRSHQICFEFYR